MKDSYDENLLIGSIYEAESCIPIIAKCVQNGEFYGFYLAGELQAFMQVKNFPDCLFLNHIVVKKKSKSNGYGKELFKYFQAMARSTGACLALEVDSRNESAFRWYLSLGFQISAVTYKTLALRAHSSSDINMTKLHYVKCDAEVGYSQILLEGSTLFIGKPSNKTYVINYDELPIDLIEEVLFAVDRKVVFYSKNDHYFKNHSTWMTYKMKSY